MDTLVQSQQKQWVNQSSQVCIWDLLEKIVCVQNQVNGGPYTLGYARINDYWSTLGGIRMVDK